MKILHIIPSLTLKHGGTSTSVRELCDGLARGGTEVRLWTTTREYNASTDPSADDRLKGVGVHLRYFPVSAIPWFGRRWAYSPALRSALRQELSNFDIVHIHTLWLYSTTATARACRARNIPYILSPCGGLDPVCLKIRRPLKELYAFCVERKTLAGAALLHFTSVMEQKIAWTFGMKIPSVVVPRSIHLDEIPIVPEGTFRKRYPEVGNKQILLFLGRLHPIKRLDILAEAFCIIARGRDDLHLVVAGPEDGAGPGLRAVLREGGLLSRVTLTGPLCGSDKWAALRDASLLLLPSEHENFGVSALEAMTIGIPVLVSDQVGLAPDITRAGAGLVLERNVEIWAKTIEQLLNDPVQRQAMGNAGIRLVKTEFSTEQVARMMRDAYAAVIQTNPRGSPNA